MSVTTTATLQTTLSWNQRDTTDGTRTTYTDAGKSSINLTMPNGSGSGYINGEWNATLTLPPSGQMTIDLFALPRELFNEQFDVAFNGTSPLIRAIYIQNMATASGADLSISATGTDAFTAPFGGGTGNIPIPAGCPYLAANVLVGWPCGPSQRFLQLQDAGSGVTIQMAIVGVTG